VVAFVFDFAVITSGKGAAVPDALSKLLPEVNVAEPDILDLQAAEWVKRIFCASPDQRLTAAHPGTRHAEVPEEEFVPSSLLLKPLVELLELPGKGLTQTVLVSSQFSLAGIREDRNSRISQLDKLRLGAKVYRVLPLSPTEHV
jgi:hypothetical protein